MTDGRDLREQGVKVREQQRGATRGNPSERGKEGQVEEKRRNWARRAEGPPSGSRIERRHGWARERFRDRGATVSGSTLPRYRGPCGRPSGRLLTLPGPRWPPPAPTAPGAARADGPVILVFFFTALATIVTSSSHWLQLQLNDYKRACVSGPGRRPFRVGLRASGLNLLSISTPVTAPRLLVGSVNIFLELIHLSEVQPADLPARAGAHA